MLRIGKNIYLCAHICISNQMVTGDKWKKKKFHLRFVEILPKVLQNSREITTNFKRYEDASRCHQLMLTENPPKRVNHFLYFPRCGRV